MSPATRRQEYARATRRALLKSAERAFARRGYAATSIEDIVKSARVTRGALYHHFSSKQEIFVAVLEDLLQAQMTRVGEAVAAKQDVWEQAVSGIDAFLDGCTDPTYGRVVVEEAPLALDWNTRREIDERHAMGLLRAVIERLIEEGRIERQPVEMLAHMLFAALTEAAVMIAKAPDRERARKDAGDVLKRVLGGLVVSAR